MGIPLWKSLLFFIIVAMIGALLLPSQRELGKIFTEGRLFQEARFYLARQFHDDPEDMANAMRYLRALRYNKESELFEKAAKNILAHEKMARNVEANLLIAEYYEDAFRFDTAASYWDYIIRLNPGKNVAPHLTTDELKWKLISYYHEHKEGAGLISYYEWQLKRSPGDYEMIKSLARLYALSGNFERADTYTSEMCRLDPKNEKAILTKAEYCEILGDNEEALIWYEKAFFLKPKEVKTGAMFAEKLIQNGKKPRALEILIRLHETFPESRDVSMMMADLYVDSGQWDLAIPMLESVIAADPDMERAEKQLADAYFQISNFTKAEEVIRRYHEKTGGDYHTHHLLGDILGARGDRDGSRRAYEKALELIRSQTVP